MKIESLSIEGFRNFSNAFINFSKKTLIIGSNDVGKTNLILGIKKLLDRSLSELDLEPIESDFHADVTGIVADRLSITIKFDDVTQDAVLATFPGKISSKGKMLLRYVAERSTLTYRILAGRDESNLEELPSRFYLKHLCMKVVDSRRDLAKFIQSEKKYLLRVAQELRSIVETSADEKTLQALSVKLSEVGNLVDQLNYVTKATSEVNSELKSLAHHNSSYSVRLSSVAVDVVQFVEKLELLGSTNGASVTLGGDGRNNQILLALWKARAAREFDLENEVVIYCVEEPEAHLHPHQQRKLAGYLTSALNGQTIVTSHSPQIVSGYSPESIIRLKRTAASTIAASDGCSDCISGAWDKMGYRMSILPAEAFFASSVLLVEGPSEILFYRELAKALNIDLDFYNISILAVDGVAFEVYAKILRAMEIDFSVRTDNDISDITIGPRTNRVKQRQLAGLNRCLTLIGETTLAHKPTPYTHRLCNTDGTREIVVSIIEPHSVFVSHIDLENDLGRELKRTFIAFKGSVAKTVKYLQGAKAIRMREFLSKHNDELKKLSKGDLAKPLYSCVKFAKEAVTG